MGNDEYSTAIGGGLKLKGGTPSGVGKKKKKKDKEKEKVKDKVRDQLEEVLSGSGSEKAMLKIKSHEEGDGESGTAERMGELDEDDDAHDLHDGKTDAERKHEEMRRKRLEDRLQKQGGLKTHKQRVEELNKYLSNLSEHHDMPRIGPG